jgi:hypothetical protein
MVLDAALADPYNGAILSMNVSGSPKPNKELIPPGILDAWLSASLITPPTIVLLQEYTFNNKELEKPGGVLDALAEASGDSWTYTRQWSETGQRDTVILYSATEFRGQPISHDKYMKEASSTAEINKIFVGRKLNKAKKKVISYATRWAGVQLAPIIKSTPLTGGKVQASRVQFLIISYHGRERREQAQEDSARRKKNETDGEVESAHKYKGTTLKSKIKKLLARDFISEVARTAMDSNIRFGSHKEGAYTKSIPALIAGDWNAEIDLVENFTSYDPSLWKCSSHAPTLAQPHLSVRKTSDGELKADIDYVVAINPEHDHELRCEVEVLKVEALVHKKSYRDKKVFDHDPLLVQFCVKPRYPNGLRSSLLDLRPPQRVAAQVALANIGRLSGREMKEQASKFPVSLAMEFIKSLVDKDETSIYGTVHSSRVEGERLVVVEEEEKERVEPPPPPLLPLSSTGERTIALSRCPKSYDLTKNIKDYTKTELKAAVKAMALDALGVQPGKKIKKEHAAFEQPWWPKNVTKRATTQFDSLTEIERFTLYQDLQDLLLARGIGAKVVSGGELAGESRPAFGEEEAPAQSNILTAKGLRSRMGRLLSREKVREP